MDFEWVAIALGDVMWLSTAFVLGFAAKSIRLPPLVGFLATGFLLHAFGFSGGEVLDKLSDLGITLLLFTVGLKLNLKTLARADVWAVTLIHMSSVLLVFSALFVGIAATGLVMFVDLDLRSAALVAFALSFSSTVFVVKALEERDEMRSLHGRIAIGVLIVQDLAAVAFLAASTGVLPSVWALTVLLLVPLRPLVKLILNQVDHGELLVLFGLVMALGGAEWFEMVGLKGDLGALVIGVLLADARRSDELAKTMLGFKDLFLLGFFLSIGLAGHPTVETLVLALALVPLIFAKSGLYFFLFTRFRVRARTSALASFNLANYSEFGLIVAAVSVANGWLDADWLIALALALAVSFALAAYGNAQADAIYVRYRARLRAWQSEQRLSDDPHVDLGTASTVVIGLGRVGLGAYEVVHQQAGSAVIGIDSDPISVQRHQEAGRNVLLGDPANPDFWDRASGVDTLERVMLALPNLRSTEAVIEELRRAGFDGKLSATARHHEDEEALRRAGACCVYNHYAAAGAAYAAHVMETQMPST